MLVSWTPEDQAASVGAMFTKAFALPFLAAELAVILITLLQPATRKAPSELGSLTVGCLAALLALAFFNALFVATNPLVAIIWTSTFVIHFLLGLAVFRLIRTGIMRPDDLLFGLFAGSFVAGVLLILFVWGVDDRNAFNWINDLPGYDNIRRLGYYAAPIVVMCLTRTAASQHWLPKAACLITAFIGMTLIFWSGTRGAVYALAITFVFSSILAPDLRKPQHWASALGITTLAFCAAWVMGTSGPGLGIGRLAVQENFSSGRVQLWQETLVHILERPLLGQGEGQIGYLTSHPSLVGFFHPHNLLLQVLLAWGLIGTVLLVLLALPAARKMLSVAQKGLGTLPYAMGALLLALYSAVDGTLFHVTSAGLFAVCSGAALAAVPTIHRKRECRSI